MNNEISAIGDDMAKRKTYCILDKYDQKWGKNEEEALQLWTENKRTTKNILSESIRIRTKYVVNSLFIFDNLGGYFNV